jgi:phosphate transport system permease protein
MADSTPFERSALSEPRTSSGARSRATLRETRGQTRERLIRWLVAAVAMAGILAIALIFAFIAKEALPLLFDPETRHEVSLGKMFLAQPGRHAFVWQPVGEIPKVSMIPLFLGTAKVTFVAIALAAPAGIAAAVFASEFAPRRLREVLKPALELLAGIPSVVLGFFGLMLLASWLQSVFGFTYRLNAVVAGVALGLSVVPVIFTVSEDALSAVPRSYREASLALGATRWETAFKIVLPAAAPGVLAACVLGLGRAIGETMIVLMASGNAAIVSLALGDSARTLSATIAAEMGEVVVGSPHYSVLFFIGVELFVITFALNRVAATMVKRILRKSQGGAAS